MAVAFGPFEIDRALGRGGMGEVFLARRRDDPTNHTIVLKRLRPEVATEDEYQKRLMFEAQVAARLDHPNLVKLIELGQVGDCLYLTMEQVRGHSLRRLLGQAMDAAEPAPPTVSLTLAGGLLEGLSVMHGARDESGVARPILHRDVKPSNVIVSLDGRAVLIDFGIAKDTYGPAITQLGRVVGTARYMAPEHRKGEFAEAPADVFSVSVVLWELLTARRPWPSLPASKEILRTVFDPPEVDDVVRRTIPPDVLQVVLRGLEDDPEKRWPDAVAMLSALRATGTYSQVESDEHRFEAVRAWVASTELSPDYELDDMVIDNAPSRQSQDLEPMAWNARGHLAPEEEAQADYPTVPPPSEVLSIPPLPPRRDASLRTSEFLVPAGLDRGKHLRWVALSALGLVGAVLGYWFSSSS